MFYSHQLLARKAALGQIWRAATTDAKINRRKLDKLNIIKICDEILNPPVPMALRLSGILMGGVVSVYERKVKLLFDDVTRLLVELNQAWKEKAAPRSIDLPKRKSQAKYETVTLPNNEEEDVPETERFLNTATTTVGVQQGAYICVNLDDVDEGYYTRNEREESIQDGHQVDADDITLWEPLNSNQANAGLNNLDERFGDDGAMELNFATAEHTQIPSTLIPSPSHQDEHPKADEIQDMHPENKINRQFDESKEANQPQQEQQRHGLMRRRGRKPAALIMDDEIIIPGNVYQSWLQDSSDLVSRRGRKRKKDVSNVKIAKLMELPPTTLVDGSLANGAREIHYPSPLLELWMESTKLPHYSPSGRTSPPQPPEEPSLSPQDRVHYQGSAGIPFEDFHSVVGPSSLGASIEKDRAANHDTNESQVETLFTEISKLMKNNAMAAEPFLTPRNSGTEVRSIPSSASGHGSPSHTSEINSGRRNKKRAHSLSRHSGCSLDPVDEENPLKDADVNFKLSKVFEDGLMPEHELLVETEPTQTQNSIIPPPIEKITDSIRMHLKTHFDTPGAPQAESLNQLAFGMDRARAAQLFYQTCVLATHDFVKVEQKEPYGDILISRGGQM